MGLFQGMNISASALTANRLRMDVVSANIANAQTTRAQLVNGQWQPYRRKLVELRPQIQGSFRQMLSHQVSGRGDATGGVAVTAIRHDPSPFKLVYDPDHPDANQDGYVQMPNVDIVREMVDLMSASRAYEANVTTLNAAKQMYMKAMEIGK
ncbi:flagellar basal-body rod protein FlgC [Caldalkalibacillus uzonensis]|uniref:Flagellar basal-body rod protein FlgC n=1 Tax=Caldalkalibacillus uzonensis TaxID=353224 RepID=A0ABU0CP39_9BACI|nr:flagellar basal body rod protein FlgC [Caldalkalibacillus uzonensis]MDQ0337260.1 flagellar basal-body rod protein FlgC [Caldalkalibacillus uzonensis]